ncbi:hypothetical protein MUN88_12265 [Gracilibacillus caseinilyticus]|uniref:Uncharacterized protein n=1 Tax=Gracilibacillus caseinilyticus TaxID=2932256 RepID=A0ABY4ER15_9BACI|nr:hypothetical protein [Gracilibacillus caseinilyticus]UOQ46867.1 hypothetical protein MUN88_12265 [Gracilibacillus caseinilyticus]
MLNLVRTIQKKFRERNKTFLALDIFFSGLTIFFALRVLFESISALSSSDVSTDYSTSLMIGMSFCLGLTFVVRVVEMIVTRKKEYFKLLLLSTIFILAVTVYMFLLEYIL